MTKAEERAILEKIVALIESTGPDSYIATAFQGCVEDAASNIDDDAAYSYYDRYHSLKAKIESIKQTLIEALIDSEEALRDSLCGYNEVILDFCENPTDPRYILAVSGRKNACTKHNYVCKAHDTLERI